LYYIEVVYVGFVNFFFYPYCFVSELTKFVERHDTSLISYSLKLTRAQSFALILTYFFNLILQY